MQQRYGERRTHVAARLVPTHALRLLLVVVFMACAAPAPPPAAPAPSPVALRLHTNHAGVQRLSAAELAAHGMPAPQDPAAQWHLHWRGHPHPLLIAADALYWYVPAHALPDAIYLLEAQPPPVTAPLPPLALPVPDPRHTRPWPPLPPDAAHATVEYAPAAMYDSLVPLGVGDAWLGQRMLAPHTEAIPLTLAEPLPTPAQLALGVWGSSSAPTSPAHRLHVRLNGQALGTLAWDGQAYYTATLDIPAGGLRDGVNQLELELPADRPLDVQQLDWLVLDYARPLRPIAEQLTWSTLTAPQPSDGWHSAQVQVFALEPTSAILTATATLTPTQGRVTLPSTAAPRHVAIGSDGWQPVQITPITAAQRSIGPQAGADYLVIGAEPLLAELTPLLDLHRAHGLQVQTLTAAQVFNQITSGTPDPAAMRALLQHAAATWQPPPRYVLLVGDATYDPAGYTVPPPAFALPGADVYTRYGGRTISDVPLADLDGDHRPDLAIGRIPATTPQQVQAWLAKLLAHAAQPAALQSALLVVDGQEPRFERDALLFAAPFAATPAVPRFVVARSPADATTVQAALSTQPQLVAYFGHGSLTQWGQAGLLTTATAAALPAPPAHLMLHFTCLTGLFHHPQQETLAEVLLWHPSGGSLALLVPTSLTLPDDQAWLAGTLAHALTHDPEVRVGDAVLRAWRQLSPQQVGTREVLETFVLLGDPAMRVW